MKRLFAYLWVSTYLALGINISPAQIPQTKLTASDTPAFGISTSISGNTAVVGAYDRFYGGNEASGSAYVFLFDGSTWIQQARLTGSTVTSGSGDNFGNSVSISGDTIVVGAYNDNGAGTMSGAAYVFIRSSSVWTQQARLTASDASAYDGFGYPVSIRRYNTHRITK